MRDGHAAHRLARTTWAEKRMPFPINREWHSVLLRRALPANLSYLLRKAAGGRFMQRPFMQLLRQGPFSACRVRVRGWEIGCLAVQWSRHDNRSYRRQPPAF